MVSFIENISDCRHFLLTNYFGEIENFKCENFCDNCSNSQNIEEVDITESCKNIFKIIASQDVSRSRIKSIIKSNSDIKFSDNMLDRILIYLISNKYIKESISLTQNNMWYEKLYLYKKSKEIFVNKEKRIFIHCIKINTISKYFKKTVINPNNDIEVDHLLFQSLKNKRNEIAKEKKIPPYCVFSNKVLESIAITKPKNHNSLMDIKGIGKEKIHQYGDMILEMIE